MSTPTQYQWPVLPFGVNSTFLDSQKIKPLYGRKLIWTDEEDTAYTTALGAGVTHLALNFGADFSGLPEANRSTFIGNPTWISQWGLAHGKSSVQEMSQADLLAAAQQFRAARGPLNIITSGTTEAYGADVPWGPAAGSSQYLWAEQALAQVFSPGEFYGEYGGSMELIGQTGGFTGTGILEAPYQDGVAALNFCTNNRGTQYPYWADGSRAYQHLLLNCYDHHEDDNIRKLVMDLSKLIITRNAMIQAGINSGANRRFMMAFCWAGKGQTLGNTAALATYTIPVSGGYTTATTFFNVSPVRQAARAFLLGLFSDRIKFWEDGLRKGRNSSRIWNAASYTGSGASKVGLKTTYTGVDDAPYPDTVQSTMDGSLIGMQMLGEAFAWAGTDAKSWVRSRPNSSGGYCSDGVLSPLMRERNRDAPLAIRIGGQSNTCALWIYSQGAGGWETRDFDVGASSPVTIEYPTGVPILRYLS